MHGALCRTSSTTLDILHAEGGPPITQQTSGLVRRGSAARLAPPNRSDRRPISDDLPGFALSISCNYALNRTFKSLGTILDASSKGVGRAAKNAPHRLMNLLTAHSSR